MARACDTLPQSPQMFGFDMVAGTRKSDTHRSLNAGTAVSGITDAAANTAGSPGASLGTGMNVDVYTPGIEAV